MNQPLGAGFLVYNNIKNKRSKGALLSLRILLLLTQEFAFVTSLLLLIVVRVDFLKAYV